MLIDTHCHLDSYHRQGILDAVLDRAAVAGVERCITVGTDRDDWSLYQSLAAGFPGRVDYTVGLHPCSVGEDWREQLAGVPAFWSGGGPKPVALGECGLDRFHLSRDPAEADVQMQRQFAAFRQQLAWVKDLGCPLVVHSRGAFQECVAEIDAARIPWSKVVFHCFVENVAALEELRRRGGHASWTGIVSYKNAAEVRASLLRAGLPGLLLETDAPYLAPVPHRGKVNEPAYLRHTAEAVGSILGVDLETVAAESTRSACAFFGLAG